MKRLIKSGLDFIRENKTIISSLLLIFVVVGAIFLNSYLTLMRFQENMDNTLMNKAAMAENIIKVAVKDDLNENLQENLNEKLNKIKDENSEISQLVLFLKDKENGNLKAVFGKESELKAEDSDEINKAMEDNAKKFAASVDNPIAYHNSENGIRYWNVTRAIFDNQNQAVGVLLVKLSLADSDALMEKSIMQVYLFSILAAFVVLLLVLNHLRLFTFEIKARKLEEIDKMKDDFISMASHELRTPLTSISGYSELLADTFSQKENAEIEMARKKYIGNIENSVERLKVLVEDLLEVSRLEQNRIPFNLKPTDVSAIIAGVSQELSVNAQNKNLELVNEVKNISRVVADPERVKQIMINLVGNAIKYTPQGKVEIQSREDEKWVYITVADSGVGISAEDMQNLFSKFYRIRNEKTASISGTGLGLWIAREIAEKMGGTLGVESIEGVGSHFTLKLKKNK